MLRCVLRDTWSRECLLQYAPRGQIRHAGHPVSEPYLCKDGSYYWISWVGVAEGGLVYCGGRDNSVALTFSAVFTGMSPNPSTDVARPRYHRFPAKIIAQAVWLYFRFALSLRLSAAKKYRFRTMAEWAAKFGREHARSVRR